ncbi:MAG TPA: DUF1351 domain-containing protein [Clostridiaceae bacterium]
MLDIKLEKQLPIVQINFEEVKASLIAGSEKYKNLVVSESTLKDCKAMQKELSKTKNDLETYRKGIKKEMLIPVTRFEGQCKELVGLIVEVENPIKQAISVFDDKAREIKRLMAQTHIESMVKELLLNDKYSSKLIVHDEYMNVSMSVKKVKEDIERRGYLLQQEQQQEVENLQIIKDTIENCNKNIDAKLDISDFQMLINTEFPISQILSTINDRAERTKANELKAIADNKAKAEKLVLERIEKAKFEEAEKVRIEERNKRIAKEAAEEKERLRLKAIEDEKTEKLNKELQAERTQYLKDEAEKNKATEKLERETKTKELVRNINISAESVEDKKTVSEIAEERFFIEMRIQGNMGEVVALSKFLKDNNYDYVATAKGKIEEE